MKSSEIIKSFCLDSTIVGLKYLYIYPDGLSRIFWTVSILFSLVLSFFLAFLLEHRFEQMPTRITIENQFAPIEDLAWPAITVCSPNQMSLNQLDHFNRTLVDGDLTLDLLAAVPDVLGFYEALPDYDLQRLTHLQHLINYNRYSMISVLSTLPQPCKQFIRLCIFQNQIRDCSSLFQTVITMHGYCCIFNSPYRIQNDRFIKSKNFTPWTARDSRVLALVADYAPQDALEQTLLNAGSIRIMFHDWKELPADDESALIYPNVEAFLFIKGTYTYCSNEVAALPSESRRCLFETEGRTPWEKYFGYRNSDCDLSCAVNAVLDKCNCILPYYINDNSKLCNVTSIPCLMDVKKNLRKQNAIINCDCPRDCDSRQYNADVNLVQLGHAKHLIINPYVNITFNSSTSILRFSFTNSFYVIQKQETVMSIINLISNLGGVFGLCLGCSVFSVIEIFFVIYKLIRNAINNKTRNK